MFPHAFAFGKASADCAEFQKRNRAEREDAKQIEKDRDFVDDSAPVQGRNHRSDQVNDDCGKVDAGENAQCFADFLPGLRAVIFPVEHIKFGGDHCFGGCDGDYHEKDQVPGRICREQVHVICHHHNELSSCSF